MRSRSGGSGQLPELVVAEAYAAAAAGVRMGVQRDLDRLGMATTLTMLVTDGRDVALGHVGDSRGYLFRDGALRQITTDHTYVQHLVDTGQLTAEDRATHPWRNVVLRSVDGDPEGGGPDIVRLDVAVGDRLLLCQRRAHRPGRRRRDRRGARLGGGRGRRGDAHPAGAGCRRPRQHHLSSSSTWSTGRRVVGDGRLLGALGDPRNVVDPAMVRLPESRSA